MSPLPPPSWKYLSTVSAHRHKDKKQKKSFDSTDQRLAIDHSLFISDRRSVKLTVCHGEGGQEKQGIKRLFEVRGRLFGNRLYCVATHTHNKMSQYLNLEAALLRLRAEVFPSLDGEAHLEVFSKEWTQIRTRSRNRV